MMKSPFTHNTALHQSFDSPSEIVPFLIERFKLKSVVDVGCGQGAWLKQFTELGISDILGIDGEWAKKGDGLLISEQNFYNHDLKLPFKIDRKFDLAISLEVAEHLPESSAKSFVQSLCGLSDNIIFSAAIPLQGGLNHINEQYPAYWKDLFSKQGFKMIDNIRWNFWNNQKVRWWYKQNMFLFTRNATNDKWDGNVIVHPQLYEKRIKELQRLRAEVQSNKLIIRRLIGNFIRQIRNK